MLRQIKHITKWEKTTKKQLGRKLTFPFPCAVLHELVLFSKSCESNCHVYHTYEIKFRTVYTALLSPLQDGFQNYASKYRAETLFQNKNTTKAAFLLTYGCSVQL